MTELKDIIVPEILSDFIDSGLMESSALLKSEIIRTNPLLQDLANSGGYFVAMPFWSDLSGDAEDDGKGYNGTALDVGDISASKEIAGKIFRAKSWGASDFASIISGKNIMQVIASKISKYWANEMQKDLFASLKGGFAKLGETHTLDKSAEVISVNDFIEGFSLLGDLGNEISTIAMHSAVFWKLKQEQMITYETTEDKSTQMPTYLGKNVIVSDNLPFETSGKIYTTYLFANGAISYAKVDVKNSVETFRKSLEGIDTIITRQAYILHPNGLSLKKQLPSRKDLENGANWEKAKDNKAIKILAIKHKVA